MRVLNHALVMGLLFLLSACYSSGNRFDSAEVDSLVPGVSTYQDVVLLLGADPVNTYRHTDGTYMARWAYTDSVLTDAIYLDRELWLNFTAQDYFVRITKRHNIPHPAENSSQLDSY